MYHFVKIGALVEKTAKWRIKAHEVTVMGKDEPSGEEMSALRDRERERETEDSDNAFFLHFFFSREQIRVAL